jgi:broad specificity phosphatase PhoE
VTLYLARHGETDSNRLKIFQGRVDIPLNSTGLDQAQALRCLLEPVPLTRAYVSPLERARVTADIILQDRSIPVSVEPRLVEIHFGCWENTPEAEVKKRWPDDYMDYRTDISRFHPEGGESAVEAQRRAGAWWDEVFQEFVNLDEHILVVAHQSLNALLACHVADIPLSEAWQHFRTRPGEIIKIVPGPVPQISRLLPDVD